MALIMKLVDPLSGALVQDGGYNVTGSVVEVALVNATAAHWTLSVLSGNNPPSFITSPAVKQTVRVIGTEGEAFIVAEDTNQKLSQVNKHWGHILETRVIPEQTVPLVWDDSEKVWSCDLTLEATVIGQFITHTGGGILIHKAQGAVLNWYLIDGSVQVPLQADEADALKVLYSSLSASQPLANAEFSGGGYYEQTVSGFNGLSAVALHAFSSGSVKVAVVPEYPCNLQLMVTPVVATINFVDKLTVKALVKSDHGTVSPKTQKVAFGESAGIKIQSEFGYHIAAIVDNQVKQAIANPYVIPSVTADHAVVVSFAAAKSPPQGPPDISKKPRRAVPK